MELLNKFKAREMDVLLKVNEIAEWINRQEAVKVGEAKEKVEIRKVKKEATQ